MNEYEGSAQERLDNVLEGLVDEVMSQFTEQQKVYVTDVTDLANDIIVNLPKTDDGHIVMDDFMVLFPKADKVQCEKLIRDFLEEENVR